MYTVLVDEYQNLEGTYDQPGWVKLYNSAPTSTLKSRLPGDCYVVNTLRVTRWTQSEYPLGRVCSWRSRVVAKYAVIRSN